MLLNYDFQFHEKKYFELDAFRAYLNMYAKKQKYQKILPFCNKLIKLS